MKVLFVLTAKDIEHRQGYPVTSHEYFHLGISYLSAVLVRGGHETELFIQCKNTPHSFLNAVITRLQPAVVCFTAVYSEYAFAASLAEYIRQQFPSIFLIVGGTHVTLNPDTAVADCWNAICVGEGEQSILELANRLQAGQPIIAIPGLWIKTCHGVHKQAPAPFIQDLGKIPHPDRRMWKGWVESEPRRMTLLLGRGCPFQCTYCCNHRLSRISGGRYVRTRDIVDVLDEIREIVDEYSSVRHIYFEIETAGVHEHAMLELASELRKYNADRLARNLERITFQVNLRVIPNKDYEPLFRVLRSAGFIAVNIGVESGCETVRRRYLKREYSNEDIKRTVASAHRLGLMVFTYVLVGIPGERRVDFQETVALLREIQPDGIRPSIVFPYPGTDMFDWVREQQIVKETSDVALERTWATMSLPGFTREEIEEEFDWLVYRVYKGRLPERQLMLEVIWRNRLRAGRSRKSLDQGEG